ncbi:DUF2637 domain-containing protein [Streptomyces sp. URMC 129]|uniref:DUF2637 domain-containing protein n=1 Tax=Streptomyces sp. URMC 129 TaxID=3423407 RepID=UPI003F1D4431
MATPYPTGRVRADWAPTALAAVMTAAFAACAFRLSFDALTALAVAHGVDPDTAWMFAALVDGGAVVGTVGVVSAARTGRRVGPYWLMVTAFAVLSLAFNVLHSDRTGPGVAVAVTPPLAQLAATELLVRMLPPAGPRPTDTAASAAPAVTAAKAAAQTAAEAAHAARAAAATVAETVRAAVTDATNDARAAATEATTAAQTAQTAAEHVTAAAAPPPTVVDLATAIATVTDTPPMAPPPAVTPPPPLPLAAVFTPPPLPPAADDDQDHDDTAAAPASPGDSQLAAAIAAYRRIRRTTGRRPTAEALGAALGVRRTRGGELRAAVEQALPTSTHMS